MSPEMWHAPMVTIGAGAALALLAVVLSVIIIVRRVTLKIEAGDGGHPVMAQAIRAHANLAEHAPLALLVLAGAEAFAGVSAGVLTAASLLLVGRALSAIGLSRSLGPSFARQAGATVTLLSMAVAAALVIAALVNWRFE
jgi:hypothetical protein